MNPRNSVGRLIAASVLGAFAWALTLSVVPQWHQRIHSDANRVEHSCAVTFIAAGNYEHDSQPPVAIEPSLPVAFERIPFPNPFWVPSPFLSASILEHAPPPCA
jgi:hypothetical protein